MLVLDFFTRKFFKNVFKIVNSQEIDYDRQKMIFKAFGSGTNDLWQTMIHSGHHLSIIGRRKMTSPRIGIQMDARISLALRKQSCSED